jgi:trigger factor
MKNYYNKEIIMQIKTEIMPTPVKYIIVLDENEITEKKEKTYDELKPSIAVNGFRKGTVPQSVAEDRLGVERLYKSIIDDVYVEVVSNEPIVSAKDFKFYGDLKRKVPFTIEFVADVKPKVTLVSFDKIDVKKQSVNITDKDIKEEINLELKKQEKIEESTKEILDNLDVAVIDFEGKLEGESTPFKGGTAKDYQITVNEIVNGKKQFVDNFEDQLVGMKINETKEIRVKFPSDYNKELADKNAVFIVTLKAIKTKILPMYNEEFVKSKEFESVNAYEENLKKTLLEKEQKRTLDDFKKNVILQIIKLSEITPIPEEMITRENEKEWNLFLKRLNKTEEQIEKEHKITKQYFFSTNTPRSIEFVKTSLVIEAIGSAFNIEVAKDEVFDYAIKNHIIHGSDEEIRKQLGNNKPQYDLMKIAARNEKSLDFVYNHFMKEENFLC